MIEPTKVELLCIPCMHSTGHTVTYRDRRLVSLECDVCHHRTELGEGVPRENTEHKVTLHEIERLYTEDFLQRILSKPQRMTRELEEDLSLFLATVPLRLVTKPYRVLKEVLRPDEHGR
ncbi:MAG: bh protein [Sulfobacillus benefaciens]|uniref:Bh protein n=1 Tax=Sulfobacillus benefaciens TaxID=453960 RepID=A0A2T2XDJ9_9FIRM|nr:MAG: bh protein [Sulfobacillus benefaciens]